ncbi:hypothetical protein GW17_00032280 [Ensete ventricosum]|nr:hypothetical protein GW17_00032280 [Ensete ventricosum]
MAIRASDMDKLSLEQLRSLKEQSDLEVNLLQDSLTKIRTAAARLEVAAAALHDLSLRPEGKELLVPLTASLYVPGTLDDSEKVLVDVGTGYFIEVLLVLLLIVRDALFQLLSWLGCGNNDGVFGRRYRVSEKLLYHIATKKKHIADEAGIVLQGKLRQTSTST